MDKFDWGVPDKLIEVWFIGEPIYFSSEPSVEAYNWPFELTPEGAIPVHLPKL